jgi:hypothetical protein
MAMSPAGGVELGGGNGMKRLTWRTVALGLCLAIGTGCAMTPDEIRAVEIENELLREQIQALRDKCLQSRELELRPEQGEVDEDH